MIILPRTCYLYAVESLCSVLSWKSSIVHMNVHRRQRHGILAPAWPYCRWSILYIFFNLFIYLAVVCLPASTERSNSSPPFWALAGRWPGTSLSVLFACTDRRCCIFSGRRLGFASLSFASDLMCGRTRRAAARSSFARPMIFISISISGRASGHGSSIYVELICFFLVDKSKMAWPGRPSIFNQTDRMVDWWPAFVHSPVHPVILSLLYIFFNGWFDLDLALCQSTYILYTRLFPSRLNRRSSRT